MDYWQQRSLKQNNMKIKIFFFVSLIILSGVFFVQPKEASAHSGWTCWPSKVTYDNGVNTYSFDVCGYTKSGHGNELAAAVSNPAVVYAIFLAPVPCHNVIIAGYSSTVDPQPISGSCGTTKDLCNGGVYVGVTDSQTQYLWSCNGSNGGTNAPCSLDKTTGGGSVINGSCSATKNSCIAGSATSTSESQTQYLWSCNGSNGGTNASCSLNKTTGGGACGEPNSCYGNNLFDSCGNVIGTLTSDQVFFSDSGGCYIKNKKDFMMINSFLSSPGYTAKNSSCNLKFDISNGSSTCSISGDGFNPPYTINLNNGSASGTVSTPNLTSSATYRLSCSYGDVTLVKDAICRVLNVSEF